MVSEITNRNDIKVSERTPVESPKLLNEAPLLILPTLAQRIGLNEAIALQQLHYLECGNRKAGWVDESGYGWVDKTYREWQRDYFPFWSLGTIKRIFTRLETLNLTKVQQLAHTKKYRVAYDQLDLPAPTQSDQNALSNPQTDQDDQDRQIKLSTQTDQPDPLQQIKLIRLPLYKESFKEQQEKEAAAKALSPAARTFLADWADKVPDKSWLEAALDKAKAKPFVKNIWDYASGILRSCEEQGWKFKPGAETNTPTPPIAPPPSPPDDPLAPYRNNGMDYPAMIEAAKAAAERLSKKGLNNGASTIPA